MLWQFARGGRRDQQAVLPASCCCSCPCCQAMLQSRSITAAGGRHLQAVGAPAATGAHWLAVSASHCCPAAATQCCRQRLHRHHAGREQSTAATTRRAPPAGRASPAWAGWLACDYPPCRHHHCRHSLPLVVFVSIVTWLRI